MLREFIGLVENRPLTYLYGTVTQYIGMVVEVEGLQACVGQYCYIYSSSSDRRIMAEVVGFKKDRLLLMPFSRARGIAIGDRVQGLTDRAAVSLSRDLLGTVIDPFGKTLNTHKATDSIIDLELYPEPGNPTDKQAIVEKMHCGVKAIDLFLPLGKGQRIGLFAGSGVGKTSLVRMMARNVQADIKVIALIGERGREVADYIEDLQLQKEKDYVVIVAAADQPPLARVHALYTATAISEYFCDKNKDVLLIVDSITRFAMAQREIGLSIGEPPTTKGYTPSVFNLIPQLVERIGNYKGKGSITGVYSVLVEGNDIDEPISDHMRAILDGHIVLDRKMADRGVFPAIDILASRSRLAQEVSTEEELQESSRLLSMYSEFEVVKGMIEIGTYEPGKNSKLDAVVAAHEKIDDFIAQKSDDLLSAKDFLRQKEMLLNGL